MDIDKVKELLEQAHELYAEIVDYDFPDEDLKESTIIRIETIIEELEEILRSNS